MLQYFQAILIQVTSLVEESYGFLLDRHNQRLNHLQVTLKAK